MSAVLWVLASAIVQAEPAWSRQLPLTSLVQGCSLAERPTGSLSAPTAVFLDCRGERLLILHPLNLVGHVRIANPEQALEFVRLFTNEGMHRLMMLDGRVEVVPDSARGVRGFNQIDSALFRLRLPAAEARLTDAPPVSGSGTEMSGRSYLIKRAMIYPDNTIRELRETVWENGYYESKGTTVLFRDAQELGLLYLSLH